MYLMTLRSHQLRDFKIKLTQSELSSISIISLSSMLTLGIVIFKALALGTLVLNEAYAELL